MSKVTMQDIADALGISRVTVWKVFHNHAGVSVRFVKTYGIKQEKWAI